MWLGDVNDTTPTSQGHIEALLQCLLASILWQLEQVEATERGEREFSVNEGHDLGSTILVERSLSRLKVSKCTYRTKCPLQEVVPFSEGPLLQVPLDPPPPLPSPCASHG